MTTQFSVKGKTAIITGAGSGINLVFATLLLGKECNVVIADLALRPESEALLAKYNDSSAPARGIFIKTDVTSWEDLRNMFDKTAAEFGSFEIVCPGAGVYEPSWSNFWHPPGTDASKDFLDANHFTTLDIDLTHPIRTTQLALQHWLKPENAAQQIPSNPKRVINVASIAGYCPGMLNPLYAAAKFGLIGFTRSMAKLETTVGVRVNAVAPGIVRTPLWTDSKEKMAYVDDKDAWITSEEVAQAMLSCVESDEMIGGTILEVGKDSTRKVTMFNDPGPDFTPGRGMMVSNMSDSAATLVETLKDGSWQA